MIKLSTYMKPLDVDSVIELDTEFIINGNKYKLYRNYGAYAYALLQGITIIGVINPNGAFPTFRDIYEYLSINIPKKRTLSIGDILYNPTLDEYNIIAKADTHAYHIISLSTGNRWNDADPAKDIFDITDDEIKLTLGQAYDRFSYVGKAKDVLMVKEC